MDQHVQAAVTEGLRRRGVDVLTTQEDDTSTLEDEALLQRALVLRRLVYTQDDDFLALAHVWQATGREFFGVAFARQLDISIGEAIDHLELLAMGCEPADVRNRVYFLPF